MTVAGEDMFALTGGAITAALAVCTSEMSSG